MSLLSIIIPTYNRRESLIRTVRSLLPQLTPEVRLIVKDNCSEPPVETYFTEEERSHFTILRNKVNIGGAANIVNAFYDCDSPWLWALGDDDFPLPDAIQTILEQIRLHPDALLFKFNSYIERTNHSFEELADMNKYRSVFSNFLFMSSGVYNMTLLRNNLQDYYKFLSSMVGQTIFVLKYLEKTPADTFFLRRKIVEKSTDFNKEPDQSKKKQAVTTTWSPLVFVKRSSLIFEAFEDKKKFLKKNLFKGVVQEQLRTIMIVPGVPFAKRWELFNYIRHKAGLWNMLRYNYPTFVQKAMMICLPSSLYSKIKAGAKSKALANAEK